ncbi:MAG: DUF2284 domain-containing protein [Syntrophobacteraceae bacterium]
MDLPHEKADVSREDFQILEDLATAFWYSEVLFAALELGFFKHLAEGPLPPEGLAARSGCELDGLARLLGALAVLGLVVEREGMFENGPLASSFLVPGTPHYAGDFLLYRRYLVPHWQRLVARVRDGACANDRPQDESAAAYQERVLAHVRALDVQARLKANDAARQIALHCDLQPRWILDLGGGAGAWCRAFRRLWPEARTVLVDLPETLAAARKLYPDPRSWDGIEPLAGNALTACLRDGSFDLILLSNILHAYSAAESEELLRNALRCLAPGGTMLIHDYLTDTHGSCPFKGTLYDLNMMLNTYNGRVYSLKELGDLLEAVGLQSTRLLHLRTDTSMLLARREDPSGHRTITHRDELVAEAGQLGFPFARIIETRDMAIEPWVRLKCQFGCSGYGASLTCPPHSPDEATMKALLSRYTHGLLVQSSPPSKDFHERLLALERCLFLGGYPEALAFGAGPCPVCSDCPPDGRCRFPDKARPSLESCGVDVYETARRAGLSLEPVTHRLGYVKFVGIVLFNEKRNHAHSIHPGGLDP